MYFPKNRIKTGLQSKGDFLIKETLEVYIGEYFETYDNKFYIGNNPNLSNLVELVERGKEPSQTTQNGYVIPDWNDEEHDPRWENSTYASLIPIPLYNPVVPRVPKPYTKLLTPGELKSGNCTRYYTKKSNEYLYFPISPEDFIKIKNEDPSINFASYICTSMIWTMGDIGSNIENASIIEKKYGWHGFTDYIKSTGNSLAKMP